MGVVWAAAKIATAIGSCNLLPACSCERTASWRRKARSMKGSGPCVFTQAQAVGSWGVHAVPPGRSVGKLRAGGGMCRKCGVCVRRGKCCCSDERRRVGRGRAARIFREQAGAADCAGLADPAFWRAGYGRGMGLVGGVAGYAFFEYCSGEFGADFAARRAEKKVEKKR